MDDLHVGARVVIPERDLAWTAARSSGKGGQNVNKVSTKVDLRFDLEGTIAIDPATKQRLRRLARLDKDGWIVVTSQATRDQSRNLEDAREKLAAMIAQALIVPKKRKATKPSKASKRRRLDAKRKQSQKKDGRKGGWD